MNRKRNTPIILVVVLVAVAILGFAVVIIVSSSGDEGLSCDWLSDPKTKQNTNKVAILIDISSSTRAKGGNSVNYVDALDDELESLIERHDTVSIGTFDGSAGTFRWSVDSWATDHGRTNQANREDDDETAKACLQAELKKAVAEKPRTARTDILDAIVNIGASLAEKPGDTRIVVATDGLGTAGCTDLTTIPTWDAAMIDKISQRCQQQVIQQHRLPNTSLAMIGVGRPAPGQPTPIGQQLFWLDDLWTRLCADLAIQDCAVSTEPIKLDGESTTDQRVTDPQVSFKGVTPTVRELDGSVLFTENSWNISKQGESVLAELAEQIKESGATSVEVHGYTEAQASQEENRKLAQHRADAVRAVLISHGVANVHAYPHADVRPGCTTRECRRRVDIRYH